MSLKATLTEAVKTAMKAKSMDTVKILRNIQAAIKQIEIDLQVELDDKAVLEVLQKQIKQRQESLHIYQSNGREDLAAQEQFEINVINQFLPAQLDETALTQIIADTIAQIKAEGMKDMGKVMNAVKEQTVGQADFGRHEFLTASQQGFAVQCAGQTVAGQGGEAVDFRAGQALVFPVGHDGPGQGMLAFPFQGKGGVQQLSFRNAFLRLYVRHLRFAFGDGAGLIQGHDLGLARFLQGNGGFEQHAVPRA